MQHCWEGPLFEATPEAPPFLTSWNCLYPKEAGTIDTRLLESIIAKWGRGSAPLGPDAVILNQAIPFEAAVEFTNSHDDSGEYIRTLEIDLGEHLFAELGEAMPDLILGYWSEASRFHNAALLNTDIASSSPFSVGFVMTGKFNQLRVRCHTAMGGYNTPINPFSSDRTKLSVRE